MNPLPQTLEEKSLALNECPTGATPSPEESRGCGPDGGWTTEAPTTRPAHGSLHPGDRLDLALTRTWAPRHSAFLERQTQMGKQTEKPFFFLEDSLQSLNTLGDEFFWGVRNKTFKLKSPSVAT